MGVCAPKIRIGNFVSEEPVSEIPGQGNVPKQGQILWLAAGTGHTKGLITTPNPKSNRGGNKYSAPDLVSTRR